MTLRRLNTGDLRTGRARRLAFSVLELLIATTIAMVILLVVTKWFRDLSVQTARSRALVEMSGQMRAVIAHLENDLRGATIQPGSLPGTIASSGYIQYVEGVAKDYAPNGDGPMRVIPSDPDTNTLPMWAAGNALAAGQQPARYLATDGVTPMAATFTGAACFQNINGSLNTAVDPYVSRFGDMDDVISLTTGSTDAPFQGQMVFRSTAVNVAPTFASFTAPQAITSPVAEVVWWVEGFDENLDGVIADAERRLHRRAFLIRPDLSSAINITWRTMINNGVVNGIHGMNMNPAIALQVMLEQCDVSFHIDANGNAVANSLADLSTPANLSTAPASAQCKRITLGLPFRLTPPNAGTFSSFRLLDALVLPKTSPEPNIGRNRFGEDVMLSNVAAFDARIFDALAPLKMHANGIQVQPGDPGYTWKQPGDAGYVAQTVVGQGAFVDLGYSNARLANGSWFSGPPSEYSGFFRVNGNNPATHLLYAYDTWTPISNDTIDGVDDPTYGTVGVIDDLGEILAEYNGPTAQAIAPPYPFPIRGLQVTLRVYDPDSKQVRQMKSSGSFTSD